VPIARRNEARAEPAAAIQLTTSGYLTRTNFVGREPDVLGGPATVTFRNLVTPAGEVGTWHYHPGQVFNVVKRGAITVEDGCGGGGTFTAGQAFETIDGRVHRAINPGAEECEEYNVFFNPPGTPLTVFIPNNERRCGPAKDVDECKNGGWMNFNHPSSFSNQGECIESVLHRP
jgi:quercetin dioxygenase-like cupin family protein